MDIQYAMLVATMTQGDDHQEAVRRNSGLFAKAARNVLVAVGSAVIAVSVIVGVTALP